jgi:short-subunit dehydrogenase
MRSAGYFKDKRIWITGASSGIGREITLQLIDSASEIIISARNENALNALRHESGHPEKIRIVCMDQSSPESVSKACEKVLASQSVPNIVFCNGGVSQRAKAIDTEEEVERYIFETNYFSQILIVKRMIQSRRDGGLLHFVVTSSLLGKWGFPLRSSYAATKHALHGYFDSLRMETRHSGVKITLVLPGFINTPISIHAMNEGGKSSGTMDGNQAGGISADECARRILSGVAAGKREFAVGGNETFGVMLRRFFPDLFDVVLNRKSPR